MSGSAVFAVLAATITLWHATDANERAALERAIAAYNAGAAARGDATVEPLAIPFGAYARKLETAIPQGQGPDLFIGAHDRLGDWHRMRLLAPVGPRGDETGPEAVLRAAFAVEEEVYAVPIAFKTLLVYWNPALLPEGPVDTRELPGLVRRLPPGVYPLAYDTSSFFFHAPFFHAFGGRIFDGDRIAVFEPPGLASFAYVRDLRRAGVIPGEGSSRLAADLFNAGRAAMVMSGPWFAGQIALPEDAWAVGPLPTIEGRPAGPFATVEGIYVRERRFAPVAERLAALYRERRRERPIDLAIEGAEARALENAVITPSRPEMSLVWEPAGGLLRDVLARDVPLEVALERARHALRVLEKPAPPHADWRPYAAAGGALALAAAFLLVRAARASRERIRRASHAYRFAAPAFLAMVALVLAPFVAGALTSLFSYAGGEWTFVGFRNFIAILASTDYPLGDPLSFYYTLAVTVLWTVANIALHVAIGVALALLLRHPWLRLRSLYRVLLILPWAIPSYITALAWRGLFDFEMGALNEVLRALGQEPVSFFARFSTAFAANLATNVWLGFPFMLVVTLGALQAVPPELEEAAALEGASRLQRFRHVTLPAIRPALAPAVVLGTVWTFNSFNVIYLVSGGEPAGKTEILISQAYKWAFLRQNQWGYAAAYAVLIFGILLLFSRLFRVRSAEGAP